jgi:hypothetical protein
LTSFLTLAVHEDVWCRDDNSWNGECRIGHGFDPEVPNIAIEAFEVRQSGVPSGGRGIYAKKAIPQGAYIGLEECVNGMFVPPVTLNLLDDCLNLDLPYWKTFSLGYLDGYGWSDGFYVSICLFECTPCYQSNSYLLVQLA